GMHRHRWTTASSKETLRTPPGGSAISTRCCKSCPFAKPAISRLRRVISPNPPRFARHPPTSRTFILTQSDKPAHAWALLSRPRQQPFFGRPIHALCDLRLGIKYESLERVKLACHPL